MTCLTTLAAIGRMLWVIALSSACLAVAVVQSTPQAQTKDTWIAFCAAAKTPNPHTPIGRDSICVVAAAGGEPREVLGGIHGGCNSMQWVPGKPILVTSVDIPQGERLGLGTFPRIWFVCCEPPGKPTSFGSSTGSFAVSPQGDRVAYVSYRHDGGSEFEVATLHDETAPLSTTDSWKVWEPCWSPDGRAVVYRAGLRKDGAAISSSWGLYRWDVTTGVREKIAPEYSFPQFLPGGDSLLVMEYTWPKGPKALHRLDVASGKTTAIASGLAPLRPALSPDGARFACVLANDESLDDSDRIAILALDGVAPREVARGRGPTWSPDGKRLAYEREGFIWVLELQTGAEHKLVEGRAPSWSR